MGGVFFSFSCVDLSSCGVCELVGKKMASFVMLILYLVPVAIVTGTGSNAGKPCPEDYRHRVETCIMEAQVAPQAGGGLVLISERNKLDELCVRGILHKTIDCLRDLMARCSHDATKRHELNMLFNLEDWKQGMDLLCDDLNRKLVFRKHFDCLSRFAPRISGCILIRTQMFKKAILEAGMATHKTLHDITCNFAENIVNCLERPLERQCPLQVVDTMVTALHRFLPPACAPLPAKDVSDVTVLETVILEGGGGTD